MTTSGNNNEITKFVKYLDFHKTKKNINYSDHINILQNSTNHFVDNNYYKSEFVGDTIVYINSFVRTSDETMKLKPRKPDNSYYQCFETSTLSNEFEKAISNGMLPKPILKTPSKRDNESIVVKTKVHIDVEVKTLDDLLKIIAKYEYKETDEYNIDLKSIVNIKTELEELTSMVGMENLKSSILSQLLYFLQEFHITKQSNPLNENIIVHEFKHTVIYGPPGTGKTEIAKIIGRMYSKIGILKNNVFKKVTRNDLVAGYLGQTALKTKSVIKECLGGVLFIDEAYSLGNYGNNDSFSKECLDVLCESLSDHKDNLMVIVAGYEEELNNLFFSANRGLESRFVWRFKIDDYTSAELYNILNKKIKETDWSYADGFCLTEKWVEQNKKHFPFFGRDMELLFTYIKISHSKRVYGCPIECRKKITLVDLNNGLELFLKNKKESPRNNIISSMYI